VALQTAACSRAANFSSKAAARKAIGRTTQVLGQQDTTQLVASATPKPHR
jgi:hypothetical protein